MCPEWIYMLWQSGQHGPVLVPCGKWRCENCAKAKLEGIWEHLDSVTDPLASLYDIQVPKRLVGAVRKAATRQKASYLGLSLRNEGLYMATSEELAGRGWRTTKYDREEFLLGVLDRLKELDPTRTTWTGAWKREEAKASGGGMLFRGVARNVAELRESVESAGLDLSAPFVDGDLLEVTERLQLSFGTGPKQEPVRRIKVPKAIASPQVNPTKSVLPGRRK